VISPGFVATDFVDTIADPALRATLIASRDRFALPPEAVARGVAFAIEQPDDVDVGEILIRPTAQG
jgi:NADP-dependent 3-hydroxy acid dehydrogenase YdfG